MPVKKNAAVTPPAPERAPSKFKIPKRVGDVADLLYKTRAERLAKKKEMEDLQAQETALKNYLIDTLPKSEASGVAGKAARVQILVKQRVGVSDWDKFYAYIKKSGSFDLLQRRPSEAAIKERWEGQKVVPGVEAEPYVDVSITKL
jgi:hypothetical protein